MKIENESDKKKGRVSTNIYKASVASINTESGGVFMAELGRTIIQRSSIITVINVNPHYPILSHFNPLRLRTETHEHLFQIQTYNSDKNVFL